jgi:hypothetical protein
VAGLVCDGTNITPSDYRWEHTSAREPVTNAPNPSFWADTGQGALAWARMAYGAEGSRLIEDDDPDVERPPAAYVELRIDTGLDEHGDYVVTHAVIVRALFDWSPVPILFCDDYTCDHWLTPYQEAPA